MVDVLDQNEVDALLAAMDAGDGDGENAQAQPAGEQVTGMAGSPVRRYDFKRPERVSNDQRRALETIHESFARNFGAAMSAFLRSIVDCRVSSTEQLTYSEFLLSLPNPTCFNLLSAPPLDGNIVLEISPLIIYPIIEKLLGGAKSEMVIPQRELTTIEHRLVRRVLQRALTNLTEVWSNWVKVTFKHEETESNPELVQIVPPNEIMVVIGFELKIGKQTGTMSLGIPFNVIEPVMGSLVEQSWIGYQKDSNDPKEGERVTRTVRHSVVGMQAFLAHTTMKMSDLLQLKPGDIIGTDRQATEDVMLFIEGKRKFAGQVGRHRGSRSIRITRAVDPEERE